MKLAHVFENNFDEHFSVWVQSGISDFFTLIFSNLTNLGDCYLISLLFLTLHLFIKDKKSSIKYLILVLFSAVFNEVIKGLVKRPRPYDNGFGLPDKIRTKGYSFPSGHSVNIGIAAWEFNKEVNKTKRILYIVLSICVVILVGYSRIYLGQHYLTDVLAGLVLATCLFFALDKLIDKLVGKLQKIKNIKLIAIGVVVLSLIVLKIINKFSDYHYLQAILTGFLVGDYLLVEVKGIPNTFKKKIYLIPAILIFTLLFSLGIFILNKINILGLLYFVVVGFAFSITPWLVSKFDKNALEPKEEITAVPFPQE